MMLMPPMLLRLLLLLLLLANAAAAMDLNDLAPPCEPFKCPRSGQTPVPRRKFEFSANGCGTASLPINAGPEFADCCNWHDACYSTCGMAKSKCEKRLSKCMKDKCAAMQPGDDKDNCESIAKLFGFGAKTMGCQAYQAAQKEACRCVAKDKVAEAMRARLVYFLTMNGATEEELADDAVDELLEKYKGREPLMFLRLLTKYPTALKIDSSKRNFMDDILSGKDDFMGSKPSGGADKTEEHIEL